MLRPITAALLLSAIETAAIADPCAGSLGPTDVVRCALGQSPDIQIARAEVRALDGRRTTARTVLPSNPVLSFAAAARLPPHVENAADRTFFNWYATLSQEVEIAGQRGARVSLVDAEIAAAVRRVAVAEQEVAAFALFAYFDVVATGEAVRIAEEVDRVAQALADLADARQKEALTSPVDADLARAEALRIHLQRFDIDRRHAFALVTLAVLLGRETSSGFAVAGTLETAGLAPTEGMAESALVEHALAVRGEVSAAEMERAVAERRVVLLRRERAPNPTFSVFAQRDGLDESVFGGGVSLPIPLPSPVGRTLAGEIAEAAARVEQERFTVERVRRQVRSEVARAWADYRARAAALQAIAPDLLPRMRTDLAALADGITSRQLSVREALMAQRALLETLQATLDVRLGYARAWVELHRAAGLPLPGVLGATP